MDGKNLNRQPLTQKKIHKGRIHMLSQAPCKSYSTITHLLNKYRLKSKLFLSFLEARRPEGKRMGRVPIYIDWQSDRDTHK